MKTQLPHDFPIIGADRKVGDFWRWAYSDVLNNRNRGILAEYIVGTALGVADGSVREEWDVSDLRYGSYWIEVKSSAYLQSWKMRKPSAPQFDIAPKQNWDAAQESYEPGKRRSSHCYVFCLYAALSHTQATDVLNLEHWQFFVLPTRRIDNLWPVQKTLALGTLRAAVPNSIPFTDLRHAVDASLRAE